MSWLEAIRTRLRLLFARGAAESRMEEEIRFHIEEESERLVREEGLDPREARRRALVAFGGVEKTKEEMRDGRGLAWLSGLRLDLKLGARMILKYPVLTLASVLALAVAVTMAASWFEFMTDMVRPSLPLPEPDRIVQVRNLDLEAGYSEPRSLHDFETWRDEVRSIEDLSAAGYVDYNLIAEDGRFGTLRGGSITPSFFRFTRVQPLLGRTLTDADFDDDAAPAAVLGHSAWQRLFDGDPSAVGQTVRLGADFATIVGVMPDGFAAPVNQEIWTPLRERALNYARREGPEIGMFGRLGPGFTLGEARAELAVIGQRTTAEFPETHEQLRPDVVLFGRGSDMAAPAALLNIPFVLFLLVVSANVATLLFARTASRESEIALRSALGASRRRLVLQLIAESLVLTAVAAALGLAAAAWGLGVIMDLFWEVQQERPPFWFDSALSATTVLYVAGLALLGAVIIGGIPGLRATRRQLRDRLPQPGAGGAGMRFGSMATGVIIVQVALCVAFTPLAIMRGLELLPEQGDSDFPAGDFLSGRLTQQGLGQRAGEVFDEVHRRVAAEPYVMAATRASRLPGVNHAKEAVEIDEDSARIIETRWVAVDPNFFDVLEARISSGRAFNQGDVAGTGVAIVDEGWAEEVFGGRSALGQRIRYPTRAGEKGSAWYEIVGVATGADRAVGAGSPVGIFHPLRPEEHGSVHMYLRTAGPPAATAPQVHALVTSVDPGVGVVDLQPLAETWRPIQRSGAFFAFGFSVVALIILLFALIGIYALMSFIVARRAREIGIRAALGADPRRIVVSIFSRAMTQIGLGVVAGAALVSLTVADSPEGIRLVAGVALSVVAVGLLACVLPATRALRIQPTEALRAE
ncbi:MAG: ABC transporter permease [Gemmatimonadetes bacterium]|nr:ABC transporter permease [Gemmatimonadota bacterium]